MSMQPRQYEVFCKSRTYPQYGVRRIIVTAPTIAWIRSNWVAIVGNPDFYITKVNLINRPRTIGPRYY